MSFARSPGHHVELKDRPLGRLILILNREWKSYCEGVPLALQARALGLNFTHYLIVE